MQHYSTDYGRTCVNCRTDLTGTTILAECPGAPVTPPWMPQGPHAVAPPKRHHVFRWFFILVQIAFLVWVIAGANSGEATDCGTLDAQTCQDAVDTGTAIGVGMVIMFWVLVDVVLLLGRLVVLSGRRHRDR